MRYLPHTDADRQAMLGVIGAKTIDDLYIDVPRSALLDAPVDLPHHQGEGLPVYPAVWNAAHRHRDRRWFLPR